mmetsp:Transcript_7563/g.14094  ORF Transcript_7563/g.14094 Transcript_7563/m.14094 type:complete len:195 (+) Transcript_7563:706-1290(+)
MASIKKGRFTISSIQGSEVADLNHANDSPKSAMIRRVSSRHNAEAERPRKEASKTIRNFDKQDSDRSLDLDPLHDPFTHVVGKNKPISKQILNGAQMKHQDKGTMTSEVPSPMAESSPKGVVDLCFAFQKTLGSKFTEMLKMHKEIMFELMAKERGRDEQLRRLTSELSELYMQNARLQIENKHLCDILGKQKE